MFLVELASQMAVCIAGPNFHHGSRRMPASIAKGFAILFQKDKSGSKHVLTQPTFLGGIPGRRSSFAPGNDV